MKMKGTNLKEIKPRRERERESQDEKNRRGLFGILEMSIVFFFHGDFLYFGNKD